MKFVSDDGKQFVSEEACRAYEEKNNPEKKKLYEKAKTIKEAIDEQESILNELYTKRNNLIREYWDKFPESALDDMKEIYMPDDNDNDDDDCENDCDSCGSFEDCILETAVELVSDLEKLQELIHVLD